ncbi:MAG: polyprenyl synthetase family protein [Chloroflexota bacterium]
MTAVSAQQNRYSADLLADLRLVTGELARAFTALPERERLPIRHPLAGQGKLLRPVVVLGASRYAAEPPPDRVDIAAVAELLHLASLIHDDVIDCAESRRGSPSLNASWGEGVAILTGDIYFSSALRRLATIRRGRFMTMFVECVADMCQSELRQTLARFDPNQSEDAYLAVVAGKTASLFATCGRAGAVLAGLPPAAQEQLAAYGWSTGMAFQLVDDVADLVAATGREPAGQDIRTGTWTLPVLHGLKSPAGSRLYSLIAAERAHEQLPAIRALLAASGSLAYAISRARGFCRQARAELDRLPTVDAAETLHGVIDGIEAGLAAADNACGD